MAWLNTAPERAAHDSSKKPNLSRLEQLRADAKDDDYQPDLPPCDADYLLSYLFEVGPCLYGGMGPAPITHIELQAWSVMSGFPLNGWEVRTLRRLSMEYIGQMQRSTAIDCAAPWGESIEARRLAGLAIKQSMKLLKVL